MIKIIDLFAGAGGLGEGFTAFGRPNIHFETAVSIEKDQYAHKTLLLRSFYRQFVYGGVPEEYFQFILSDDYSMNKLNALLDHFPEQGQIARREALCLELGNDDEIIYQAIEDSLIEDINASRPWVLIGGPPCQAYSLVGRARNKGKVDYRIEGDKRSTLYLEYLRILARFQPAVFVMENVKGMLSANVGGERIINKILNDLRNPGQAGIEVEPITGTDRSYRLFSLTKEINAEAIVKPEDFLIKSELYGIPQKRHRVIILGVRNDIAPEHIRLLEEQGEISLKNTISDLPAVFSEISNKKGKMSDLDKELMKYDTVRELLWKNFKKRKNVSQKVQQVLKKHLREVGKISTGSRSRLFDFEWFDNPAMNRAVCNHEPRTHMRSDFLRYFFVCCYGLVNKKSPTLEDFPKELLPAHKNINSGKFVDRFKVQLADHPATTITSHISKDGNYYIHPDPRQCRSLTVREAARIQTFPDDYFFCGNRTQQYHQVGNAVPPLLARQIAGIVHEILADNV